VLVTSRARQIVVVVPLLMFGFGMGMGALAVNAVRGQTWGVAIGAGLFGALVLWMALSELAVVRIDQRRLLLWGPFRRRELLADACAFGVRLETGSESSRYIVFAMDGQASVDLGEWSTERGARRSIERACQALYGASSRSGSSKAQRDVEQVERAWQANVAEARKTLDAYYQSPTWRIAKYVMVCLIVSSSIGMLIYLYFTGSF